MSYIASDGDTRKELKNVFHFPDDNETLLNELTALRKQLHETDNHEWIDLSMANSVWLDETYADFQKDYLTQVQRMDQASLHRVTFEQSQSVSNEINQWLSEKTHGRIINSVSPGDFGSRSRPNIIEEPALVLVNAAYFNADWASRFDKSSTRKEDFHPDRMTTVQTPMMHQRSRLSYSESEQLKFLELPYMDNLYSMYLILPKENTGIPELMEDITTKQIFELQRRAFGHDVDVLLPKFEMKSQTGVKDTLSTMGVTSAFDYDTANFDKMIIKKHEAFRLYISEIHHDAWIGVDEEGTEAAAGTSTVHYSFGCSGSIRPMPVTFHANHPFLFMVVHNKSRSILFAGYISNPALLTPSMN